MSDEELQEKALGVAKHTLSGKSDLERAAVLHQHIGRRAMGDMVIETFEPSPGERVQPQLSAKAHHQYLGTSICRPSGNRFHKCLQLLSVLNTAFQLDKGGGTGASTSSEQKSIRTEGAEENGEAAGSAPDSPSKQLPDHISFFSGNPSVEIIHGVMHLYKTKSVSTEFRFAEVSVRPGYAFSESLCSKMTSLTEDVRRSAMVCILTVPATMTSHDLMKLMAPFNDVMEHMKIIRDSTPNQYMVLIKFCRQVGFPLEST